MHFCYGYMENFHFIRMIIIQQILITGLKFHCSSTELNTLNQIKGFLFDKHENTYGLFLVVLVLLLNGSITTKTQSKCRNDEILKTILLKSLHIG